MEDLREFHTPDQSELGNTGKIIGGIVVAAMIATAGAYTYEAGLWSTPPKQIVASNTVPPPAAQPIVTNEATAPTVATPPSDTPPAQAAS